MVFSKLLGYGAKWINPAIMVWAGIVLAHQNPTDGNVTRLAPGVSTQHTLAGEGPHLFMWRAARDVAYQITLTQRGRDVVLNLVSADKEPLQTVNSPIGKRGPEILPIPAGEPRPVWVEVKPKQSEAAAGVYDILLEAVPAGMDDPLKQAKRAYSRASSHFFAGEAEAALAELGQAQAQWPELEKTWQAITSFGMGRCAARLHRWQDALDFYHRALVLWESLDDPFQVAQTLNGIGFVHQSMGEHKAALPVYRRAQALFLESGDLSWQAAVNSNLGMAHDILGEPQNAASALGEALETYIQTGDRRREAWLLTNMGSLYQRMGDWQVALDHYRRALAIHREKGSKLWEARTLNNMGFVYLEWNAPEKAASLFERALPLRKAANDRRGEAVTLSNLARARHRMGKDAGALEAARSALTLQQTVGDQIGEGTTHNLLGSILLQNADRTTAAHHLRQARELLERLGDRHGTAIALGQLGEWHMLVDETDQARAYFQQALAIHRQIQNPAKEAETLLFMARLAQHQLQFERARTLLETAIERVESLRGKIGSQDLRASWFATQRATYENLIAVLMDLHRTDPDAGYDRRALTFSERAQARGLLEVLHESQAQPRRGIDPAFIQRRQNLLKRLEARSRNQMKLLSGEVKQAHAESAESAVQEVLIALDELDSQIRQAHPRHADILRPQPLAADQIGKYLDDETLLLAYALGQTRSYAWEVTRESIAVHELPGRAEIEAAARNVYRLMALKNPQDGFKQRQAATKLSRILLGPMAGRLGSKRLAVVADGVLHYLPFAALPLPAESNTGEGRTRYTPLLERHQITMLPSASFLAVPRANWSPSPLKKVAILADPVFGPDDPRLAERLSAPHPRDGEQGPDFVRLRASRREAQAIANLAGSEASFLALDFDASRETVLNGSLAAYAYLHFATHGLLNSAQPELSAVVLSLFDSGGNPRPGLLTLPDIFNLELNANLVVLSGCQTALGKEVRGEGLVGLARGFLHAGAGAVMASLWRVEDRATALLMEHFYRAHWVEGQTPAAALREAQRTLYRERRHRDPWYWAAFVIHGG